MSKSVGYDVIKSYVKDFPELKGTALARKIIEDHDLEPEEEERIRGRVNKEKKRLRRSEHKDSDPEVIDEHYQWKTIYGDIDIPVSLIDEMFWEYSKHGLVMSETQMINKHNLEAWQWQSIKRKLRLVRPSNIFSPYTVEKYSGVELENMINEKMSRKYKNKGALVEEAYKKQVNKQYEKVIAEDQKQILEKDIFYNEILRMLPQAEIAPSIPIVTGNCVGHSLITIADPHNGARIEHIQNTPNYNPVILEGYLDSMAKIINSKNRDSVTLCFLGDLIESFTGLNHKNSWKGIEYAYFGANVVIKTVELMTRFISKVNNVSRIIGVNGNHDRSTSDSKEDTRGEIGTIIFFMLRNIFSKTIEIIHQEDVVSLEIDRIQYIVTHGHLPESKKGADKIINEYGNNKLFNLILTGHLHSRIIKDDAKNFRHVYCPSLFTGNRFSKTLGFSTTPGFLDITNNGMNKPNIKDYSL